MREAGIYTVLVKGQGVGQCYERPLWRSCGDVDLFFDAENYEQAKAFLSPLAVEDGLEEVLIEYQKSLQRVQCSTCANHEPRNGEAEGAKHKGGQEEIWN